MKTEHHNSRLDGAYLPRSAEEGGVGEFEDGGTHRLVRQDGLHELMGRTFWVAGNLQDLDDRSRQSGKGLYLVDNRSDIGMRHDMNRACFERESVGTFENVSFRPGDGLSEPIIREKMQG